MIYNESKITDIYDENLQIARQLLSSLPVAEGRKPSINGLSGWVFEQTVHKCLIHELKYLELTPMIKEQEKFIGRARVDLLVGNVAIEIKARGSFSKNDADKYTEYKNRIKDKGWVYCYLTLRETYPPYRLSTENIFGKEYSFFLDTPGDWERFVRVIEIVNNGKG